MCKKKTRSMWLGLRVSGPSAEYSHWKKRITSFLCPLLLCLNRLGAWCKKYYNVDRVRVDVAREMEKRAKRAALASVARSAHCSTSSVASTLSSL